MIGTAATRPQLPTSVLTISTATIFRLMTDEKGTSACELDVSMAYLGLDAAFGKAFAKLNGDAH